MMKKFAFFLLLCLPLCSCTFEGDEVTEVIGSVKNTYSITIKSNQWQPVGTYGQPNYYLQAPFQVAYITPDVIYKGAVLVYAEFTEGSIQLPSVISGQASTSRFVSILSYTLNNGFIIFTLENSNFQANPIGDTTFKIVVIE